MHRSAHNGPRSGRVGCQAQHVGRSLRCIWFNIALFVSETGEKGKCTGTTQLKRHRLVGNHSIHRGPAFKNHESFRRRGEVCTRSEEFCLRIYGGKSLRDRTTQFEWTTRGYRQSSFKKTWLWSCRCNTQKQVT